MRSDYYSDYMFVSQSMIKVFARSPETYRRRFVLPDDHPEHMNEPDQTDSMAIGSVAHAVFLEQDTVSEFRVIDASTKSTNLWKAESANAKEYGQIPVLKNVYEKGVSIARAARSSTCVERLLASIPDSATEEREVEIRWQGKMLPKKAKIDSIFGWKNGKSKCFSIVELKTTSDPSRDAFLKQYFDMKYHMQAAWYQEGVESEAGKDCDFRHFVIAVRNSVPFDTAVYEIDTEFVKLGFRDCEILCNKLANCLSGGEWSLESVNENNVLSPLTWMTR